MAAKPPAYGVCGIAHPAGQAQLARRGLTTRDLARAIAQFERIEAVRMGTLIGVNDDGVFGSIRVGWRADQAAAFDQPLLHIPWGQIHALLAAIEDPDTGELCYDDGNVPH